ncbi:SRPBCC family protein [Altibacter sp. HG106]|uniref:SRPBCC family protein n=1 Tax=Altibacter sp. HG106 TaxID=3023937 RepID=UPI0023509968|nr:SRPBCC family protein [Altibacter sp. HG106]MDC7993742.1 SRPBCC family protein [Altibacter sp. HG106]
MAAVLAPKKYDVRRSILVDRSLPEVFEYLKYLKNQDQWSPWSKRDPNMQKEIRGTDGTVGAVSHWKGNKKVGEGEQEIKSIIENERIDSELRFLKPFKSTSDAYLLVRALSDTKTEVTWGFSGTHKPPMNVMMLFFNMEKSVGTDFEAGLRDLKLQLETP